ncbi:GNAT family N-acetyltransferase [Actinoalloteichus spitiensis]|uniref:GNAT family N-acetyltransferase n=1 Tax=Actinoalloteichus spitiensis TaxID=252394 RepID=UPI0003719101|nr:GNAT family N-acetyltransferase [Actinoalloteichus spitiensis]
MTLRFRRTRLEDLPLIQSWLRRPHVARYWAHDTSDAAIERDFAGSVLGEEPSEDYLVFRADRPIGFAQRCRIHDYPEGHRELVELVDVPPDALTIDYFIGEAELLGQGLGTRLVEAFTGLCWRDHPEASAIIVPVAASNTPSWAALRRAGYSLVATGYLTPDNPLDDGIHHVHRADRPRGRWSHPPSPGTGGQGDPDGGEGDGAR